jgi:3-oxoadipate enol-lactonase
MKSALLSFLLPVILGSSVQAASPSLKLAHVSYSETGNSQGIPIVFIHAFPLNKKMWDGQAAFLKNDARVITFDIRGLGDSELTSPYTLEFVVDDLISLLDQLKIKKAVVCGLSMGGFVALRAVERNPERFMGLILADTKSEPDSDTSKLGRYQALKTIQEKGQATFVDTFLKSALAPTTLKNQPAILKQSKDLAEMNNASGISAAVLALTSRTDTTPELGKIHVPTMILQGEFDTVIPLASAQSLHDKIPKSTFFIIPSAGHLSNLENPDQFNSHLSQFIHDLKSQQSSQ